MTTDSNARHLRTAHAAWLRDKAAHFRRLAGGAIPYAAAQDLERLATKYERLAAALESGAAPDAPVPATDAAA